MKTRTTIVLLLTSLLIHCNGDKEDPLPPPPSVTAYATLNSTGVEILPEDQLTPGDTIHIFAGGKAPGGLSVLSYTAPDAFIEYSPEDLELSSPTDTIPNLSFQYVTDRDDEFSFLDFTFIITDVAGQVDTAIAEVYVDQLPLILAMGYALFLLEAPQPDKMSASFFSSEYGRISGDDVEFDQTLQFTGLDMVNKVDLGYYYTPSDGISFASPSFFPNTTFADQVAGWDTLHTSQLTKIDLSLEDFNAIEYWQDIDRLFNDQVTETSNQLTGLEVGDFVIYERYDGVRGIIYLRDVEDLNDDGQYDGDFEGVYFDAWVQAEY
jgi:hypothetical protein